VIVVLDSGIWISGFHFGGIPLAALDQAFIYDHIAICEEIITEVSTIMVSKFGWTERHVHSALRSYLAGAKHVTMKGDLTGVCRDPKDDMLFECAVRAKAESSSPATRTFWKSANIGAFVSSPLGNT